MEKTLERLVGLDHWLVLKTILRMRKCPDVDARRRVLAQCEREHGNDIRALAEEGYTEVWKQLKAEQRA